LLENDGLGQVQVDVTISFDAKNYSDLVLPYVPIFQEETFYSPELQCLEYGILGQQPYIETLEETNTTTKVKTVKGKHTIKLQPFRSSGKSICQVKMRYRLRMPENYSDVTSFAGPTIGATLVAQNIPPGFDVVSIGENTSTNHQNGDKSWYFDRPFITNQHIRVWWFRQSDSKPATSQTSELRQ